MSDTITTTKVKIGRRPTVITLTDPAIHKVSNLLKEEGGDELFLRVAVKPGGCSGYSYDMYFDTAIDDTDIVEKFSDFKVVVDGESAELLKGAVLEYEDGLQGAGFHITNPNATKTCGCGSSFS